MPTPELWTYLRTVPRRSEVQYDVLPSYNGVLCASQDCVYVSGGDIKLNGLMKLSELHEAMEDLGDKGMASCGKHQCTVVT